MIFNTKGTKLKKLREIKGKCIRKEYCLSNYAHKLFQKDSEVEYGQA